MEEKEEIREENPARRLMKRIKDNKTSIHIARVPEKTRKAFLELAKKEFCSDYGMLLKWLMDDLIRPDTKMLILKIEELDARMKNLEIAIQAKNKDQESVDKGVKLLSGKKFGVKKG